MISPVRGATQVTSAPHGLYYILTLKKVKVPRGGRGVSQY